MRGVTLIELVVSLAILGVVASVTALAVGGLHSTPESRRVEALGRVRATVIRTGRAAGIADSSGRTVRFLPDGRGIGAGIDPLTGEAVNASR
jgi:prepilin-type N-terminal cleavage/methylation domain-containing protein